MAFRGGRKHQRHWRLAPTAIRKPIWERSRELACRKADSWRRNRLRVVYSAVHYDSAPKQNGSCWNKCNVFGRSFGQHAVALSMALFGHEHSGRDEHEFDAEQR